MNYWKLKSQILEIQMMESKLSEIKNKTFIEAGLDPNKNYKMNDETETVEEVKGLDNVSQQNI